MTSSTITKIQTTYTPDGQGGYTEETIELGSFDVKLSIGQNVEEATAYGVSVEEMLKVIADVPLLEEDSEAYIIIGPAGKDGSATSPTIEEKTNTDTEYILTITDVNGSYDTPNLKGADGADGATGPQGEQGEKGDKGDTGATGQNGADGADGYSPTIEVKENTSSTYILTVTNADGSYDTPNLKGSGGSGGTGYTFTPSVSEDGVISWTNDGGLENPDPVNIMGPQGEQGIQGEAGNDGVTPSITATATIDSTSGTPQVTVTKSGSDETPSFAFDFTGLKGEQGEQGIQGEAGTNGTDGTSPTATITQTDTGATITITDASGTTTAEIANGEKGEKGDTGEAGTDGVTPSISATATVDNTSSDTPTVTVTKSGADDSPSFDFAFVGLKGSKGDTGEQGPQGETGATGEQGPQGEKGDSYTITDSDYSAIAALVYSNYMTNAANVSY